MTLKKHAHNAARVSRDVYCFKLDAWELYKVDQAAALWAGYDPRSMSMSDIMKPSEVIAAKQMLVSWIVSGELFANSTTNYFAKIGNYSDSLVSRQGLELVARKRGLFPAFLFDTLAPLEEPTSVLDRQNRLLPKNQGSVVDATAIMCAPNRGGRPQEYDWDAFVMEIISRANQPDGLPPKQADLVDEMLGWFADTYGKEPAESSVKDRISKIYRYLSQAKNLGHDVSGPSG